MGASYWKPFTELLKDMVAHGTISSTDLDLFLVTDNIPDAMAHIEHHAIARFGLRRRKMRPASRWLGEESLKKDSPVGAS
jgi:predicted Rossmann-fold nucleotide-binding protein